MRVQWATPLARHAILIGTTLFAFGPFLWMIFLSLVPEGGIVHGLTLRHYQTALQSASMMRFLMNGVLVCGTILLGQIAIALPCAYALAKLRLRHRRALLALVYIGLLVPPQALAFPMFIGLYGIGLLDTYAALILPFLLSPFAIFLFYQYLRAVPDELVQAARVDGLSEPAIVWRLIAPVCTPSIAAFAMLSVVTHWNDLFWPLVAIRSENLMTPSLGIVAFRNEEMGSAFGPMMAGATLVVAPIVALFLIGQRGFIEGLTRGTVK